MNLPTAQFLDYNSSVMLVLLTQCWEGTWLKARGCRTLYRACQPGRVGDNPSLEAHSAHCAQQTSHESDARPRLLTSSSAVPHSEGSGPKLLTQGLCLILVLVCSTTHLGHIFVQRFLSLLYVKAPTPSPRPPSHFFPSHSALCLSFSP